MRTLAEDAAEQVDEQPRSYQIRTFGCQMNVHDSERLAGVLDEAGYVPFDGDADEASGHIPDLIVFNTCAVRENADNRLYGTLGHLRPWKDLNPRMQIAVGGCLAQKDKNIVVDKAPWVDVVFGTHNMGHLPSLLQRSRHNEHAEVEIADALQHFPSNLPAKRESAYAGWVSVSVGCNNTCTFCIVPSLRGKEVDRRPGEVLAEVEALVSEGVLEVTLLGQNVNAYGKSFIHPDEPRNNGAFADLLRACGHIEGLERVRFTSPHPAEFTDDVIAAMAETPNVCPQLHMPLQSGSDRILRAMRRSYRRDKFLGIIDKVRAQIPHAAITTDIIVGFPGETEEDFQQTLEVVEKSRFTSAFTFQYSPRPGTPAAMMDNQIPKEVVQDRYERLLALQEQITLDENRALVGTRAELLIVDDSGRKNHETSRMSGRARDGRLVHFSPEPAAADVIDRALRPGDIITVEITAAAPHHLLADGGVLSHRRTVAGDHHENGQTPTTAPVGVGLGLPTIRSGA